MHAAYRDARADYEGTADGFGSAAAPPAFDLIPDVEAVGCEIAGAYGAPEADRSAGGLPEVGAPSPPRAPAGRRHPAKD